MAIYVEVDISDVARELDRLISEPSTPTVLGLEGVLATTFAATQVTVPVDTGSLRASGGIQSSLGPAQWEGVLNYGGDAGGFPHDPVLYAAFVLGGHRIVAWGHQVYAGKQYQEPDDFMAPFDVPGEQAFEAVVLGAVRGV
jgi:hypothetical protein